ncbi:hypothetical protein BCR42DRAFT_436833 [Absidia repens]|nr:hypothetical protein BCR42DRAFT_436833 [Absidia repens]
MPRISRHLNANSKVKVSARFLRKTDAPDRLTGLYDFNSPRCRRTIARYTNEEQKVVYKVVLDVLPDKVYTLLGNSIKYVGAVDIANNRRDNLNNFHDIMKSYRWEIQTLAFFLGIAEVNAFSAYKKCHRHGASIKHNASKYKLAEGRLKFVTDQRKAERQMQQSSAMNFHKSVKLGKLASGNNIRRKCSTCSTKTEFASICTTDIPLRVECW